MADASSQRVVIVGAGPAGLLLTHYLLRRGYTVEIYEQRPDPREVDPSQRRSFPITLQQRGRTGLQGISGLEESIGQYSTFCQGTVVHSKNKARDIKRNNVLLTVDRNQLTLALLQHLTEQYASTTFTLRFNCVCQSIDIAQRVVTFKDKQAEDTNRDGFAASDRLFTVSFDRLVGADGANSRVRQELVEHHQLGCTQTLISDAYKSLFLARTNPEQDIALAPDRLHTANTGTSGRVVLAPQPGDRLHGAFVFNAEKNPFASFTTKEDVLTFFEEKLPTFRPLLSDTDAEGLLQRPVARLTTVKCDRLHEGDRVLLIGDAAHAVSPSIGQGCNAALEDVAIIDQLLDRYQDDWSQALPQFSQRRVPDAHALIDLSDHAFPRSKMLVAEFFLRLIVGRKLNKWFPQWFKPFLLDLVVDSDLPYAEVLKLSQGWVNKVKASMAP
ncbi:MAG: NAD(P)/FAD-dependent oxidoreductase [Cyanobacteria bacterium P01_F01_bin.150]